MARTVFQTQIAEIDRQREAIKDSLASGAAKDYAHYRELVGVIRGLDSVRRYVEDLSQSFMETYDD